MLSFLLNDFSQTEQNQLMSTPQEQYVDSENGSIMRIDIVLKAIKFNSFRPPPPLSYCVPPPPPPHFFCFPSTPTTATTTATTFPLFFSTTVNKRLRATIITSVCRNVSSCQEQSWFSSILSCLSSSSATVSFTDSQSTTTTCISQSLIQYT